MTSLVTSMSGEGDGRGLLKFTNSEVIQLLEKNSWKCSKCKNPIKKFQTNRTFLELNKEDPRWFLRYVEYLLYKEKDINIKRIEPRGTKESTARLEDRSLNYDNLRLLCENCADIASKDATITFRIPEEKKTFLKEIAKDRGKSLTQLLSQIIDDSSYDDSFTIQERFEKSRNE